MPRDVKVRFDAHEQLPFLADDKDALGPHPQRASTVTYCVLDVPDDLPPLRVVVMLTQAHAAKVFRESVSYNFIRSHNPWRVRFEELLP